MTSLLKCQSKVDSERTQSLIDFIKQEAVLKIDIAHETGNCIAVMARKNKNETFNLINSLLHLANESLSVAKPTTSFQAMEIIYMIMNDFKQLTIEEVAIVFRNGKKGFYGSNYNKLDVEVFSNWFISFVSSDEYCDYLENRFKKVDNTVIVEMTADKQKSIDMLKQSIDDIINQEKKKPITRLPIMSHVSDEEKELRLKALFKKLSEKDLEKHLFIYKQEKFDLGIYLINEEIKSRI